MRAFYDHLKARTGLSLGTDHPIFEWMVEWAATMLTRFVIRGGGKTSYERIGGRTRDNLPMAIFGERVCYLPLKTNRREKSKLERMREGIWLGMRMRTNKALLSTLAGVVKARTIRIQPEDEKWSAAIDEITFDHLGHDDRDKDHEGKESRACPNAAHERYRTSHSD